MAIEERELDRMNQEEQTTEKGTIFSVTVVGVFILLLYLVIFGLYMSRV